MAISLIFQGEKYDNAHFPVRPAWSSSAPALSAAAWPIT